MADLRTALSDHFTTNGQLEPGELVGDYVVVAAVVGDADAICITVDPEREHTIRGLLAVGQRCVTSGRWVRQER